MARNYERELTNKEIDDKFYRDFVGGMWDEIGLLQYRFMTINGLLPQHKLLDIGCGALRGGIHFIRYLNDGNYYGIDMNASLVKAALHELEENGLSFKNPKIIINDKFEFNLFDTDFDFCVAQSLFTHLPMNDIVRCLVSVSNAMQAGGVLFATYFDAPESAFLQSINHVPGGIVTNYDKDPYHYSFEEFVWMANLAGLSVVNVGEWGHPRSQKMLKFCKSR